MNVIASVLSSSMIASSSVGHAVSFSESGKAVVGAGTTLYKETLTLEIACLKYLNVDSLFDSSFLYARVDSAAGTYHQSPTHPNCFTILYVR